MAATVPNVAKLAEEALAGDQDAALELARARPHTSFLTFLAKYVPDGQMSTEVFDVMSDAYSRMEQERDLDEAMTAEETP